MDDEYNDCSCEFCRRRSGQAQPELTWKQTGLLLLGLAGSIVAFMYCATL